MRRLIALLVLALLAGSCTGGGGPDAGQATLSVDGSATVTRADGEIETVTDGATLETGDTVEVTLGTATLELFGGDRYALRASIDESPNTQMRLGVTAEAVAGDVLVLDGNPARLVLGDTVVSTQGRARVDVETRVVAVYLGRTSTAGGGEPVEIPALRQANLVTSAFGPLDYDGTDPWDRNELGDAITVGERLEAIARGYTADLRVAPNASFYESVLPALAAEPEFQVDLLDPGRDAGETLVGAAIAVQASDGNFRDRWDETFGFRDEGAVWGLVARDQGVNSQPLFDQIEVAIDASPGIDTPRSTTTTRPPRTTTTIDRPGATTTTTTAPPEPQPEPGPVDVVVDTVGGLVGDVFDLLGLGPSDSGSGILTP